MSVLVLAQELDRSAKGVITGLVEAGQHVMRIDLSWFPQQLTLDAEFCDGWWQGCLRTEHHTLEPAAYRPLQYVVGVRVGLRVPRTLISNSPSAVSRFACSSPTGVVAKPLTTNLISEDGTY